MFYVSLLIVLSAADNQSTYNTLTNENAEHPVRFKKHHRTESLPTGYLLFQEPPKIAHTRTRSEPLTGDELDRAILEKSAMHSSCKAVNGTDILSRKTPWCRRASTGTKFTKLSPAHTKCMYTRACINPHRMPVLTTSERDSAWDDLFVDIFYVMLWLRCFCCGWECRIDVMPSFLPLVVQFVGTCSVIVSQCYS